MLLPVAVIEENGCDAAEHEVTSHDHEHLGVGGEEVGDDCFPAARGG